MEKVRHGGMQVQARTGNMTLAICGSRAGGHVNTCLYTKPMRNTTLRYNGH